MFLQIGWVGTNLAEYRGVVRNPYVTFACHHSKCMWYSDVAVSVTTSHHVEVYLVHEQKQSENAYI